VSHFTSKPEFVVEVVAVFVASGPIMRFTGVVL
jgi:hypothetical protein